MIDSFRGGYRYLSNFAESPVEFEDKIYRTTEHAYQASKTFDINEREEIRNALTPGKAKRLGGKVTLRPDWDQVKLGIMESLCRQKFTKCELYKAGLLATGDQELVEGNNYNDTFWGVCNGKGENHLGKILMKIRAELRTNR